MSKLIPPQHRRWVSRRRPLPDTAAASAPDPSTEFARTAVWVATGPQAVRQAREFVVRRCAEWECPPGTADAARLVVSELVTSIELRSGPDLELTAAEWSGQLYLIIREAAEFDQWSTHPPERTHLNGLARRVVESLSRSWGELPPAGTDGPGYWAVLDIDPASAPD